MAARVEVTFNASALRSLAIQGSEDELRVRANRVLSRARSLAPVDKGTLRASLAVTFARSPAGEPVARIGSNLPYAIWVEQGTGIYGPSGSPITPRNGRYLVFTPRGATKPVFARSVRGRRATPFLTPALDAAR